MSLPISLAAPSRRVGEQVFNVSHSERSFILYSTFAYTTLIGINFGSSRPQRTVTAS
jgi:hypothetical protein